MIQNVRLVIFTTTSQASNILLSSMNEVPLALIYALLTKRRLNKRHLPLKLISISRNLTIMERQPTMSSMHGFTWPIRTGTPRTQSTTQEYSSFTVSSATSLSVSTTESSSRSASSVVSSPTSTSASGASAVSTSKSSSGFSLQVPTMSCPGVHPSSSLQTPILHTTTSSEAFPSKSHTMTAAPISKTTAQSTIEVATKSKTTITVTVTSTELSGPETMFVTVYTSSVVSQTLGAVV
jgi:hypothetical protein